MKPTVRAPLACVVFLTANLLSSGCDTGPQSFRHQFYAFGTLVTIDFFDTDARSDKTAAAAIQLRTRDIDLNWYPWREQNGKPVGELQRINAAIAAGQPIEVSPKLAELLRRSSQIESRSGGTFNPAIGHLTELWGLQDLARPHTSLPDKRDLDKWLAESVSSADLTWDGNTLRSSSPAVMLDLGGIAKGAILQQFVEIVRMAGITDAIIDLGGDLTVMGNVHGRAARIGIRSPRSEDVLAWLEVGDGETVMTSGDYERYFEYEGQRYQHILDPRNAYPVQHTISATVVHRDPVLADAAATALLVGGPAEFEQLCAAFEIDEALLVAASGELRLTPAMEKRLHWAKAH